MTQVQVHLSEAPYQTLQLSIWRRARCTYAEVQVDALLQDKCIFVCKARCSCWYVDVLIVQAPATPHN